MKLYSCIWEFAIATKRRMGLKITGDASGSGMEQLNNSRGKKMGEQEVGKPE